MMTKTNRGVILPVVLMVILLLTLLGSMFAFRINADYASTKAMSLKFQTRLAAEAGVERAKLFLKEHRFDVDQWYHNEEIFHRIIVWSQDGDESEWGSNQEFDEHRLVYRFSIVADDPNDDEDRIRLGVTDEASKLNLNTATARQLMILVRAAMGENPDEEVDPRQIVDAILDWRDADSDPRGDEIDTEGDYYLKQRPAYLIKNGPFDTVEELLLVKGVTGQLLFGEDYDRNGLITPNEKDGDDTFPPDDENDKLNRGLYPYLTVHSKENNVSNDNRARVYLLGEADALRSELELLFPDETTLVEYIVSAMRQYAGGQNQNDNNGDGNADNEDGGSNPPDDEGDDNTDMEGEEGDESDDENAAPDAEDAENENGKGDESEGEGDESDDAGSGQAPIRTPASLLRDQIPQGRSVDDRARNSVLSSPVTVEHLAILLDKTTTVPPDQRELIGRININTASSLVLRCLDGLTAEQIETIVEMRGRISSDDKLTTAWLLKHEVVDLETFEQIEPQITARGQQFTIQSLGYADHVGMVTRLQVVVDFLGPIAQTVYYRDLSYLGGHFPIREEDLERISGR